MMAPKGLRARFAVHPIATPPVIQSTGWDEDSRREIKG